VSGAQEGKQVDILRGMRRWIAMFLLALLPFQALWAAVEPYCLHERAPSAAHHLGHHEHSHHAEVKADQAGHSADADLSQADAMADHDHHCCGTASLLPASLPWPGTMPPHDAVASPLAAYASVDATRIDRPNWPRSH
jgi:hypothetical protein